MHQSGWRAAVYLSVRRVPNSLDLELERVASCQVWVLGTEAVSAGEEESAISQRALS